jgi:hypothetical protein
MMRAAVWLRRIAVALLFVVLSLAALTARAIVDGEEQMRLSDAAFDRGDVRTATQHARRSAVLYAPGAPHVQSAYDRLHAIARGAEAAGYPETAQAAWRAVRGAALETRHLWIPRAADLERANENLARLSASRPKPGGGPADEERAEAAERARRELDRDHAPKAPWIAVLVVGFVLSAIGLALAALLGVSPDGKLALRPARYALLLATVGAACWTLAVLRA